MSDLNPKRKQSLKIRIWLTGWLIDWLICGNESRSICLQVALRRQQAQEESEARELGMLYNASAGTHSAVSATGGPPVVPPPSAGIAAGTGQELALNILQQQQQQQQRGVQQPAFPGATNNSEAAPPEPIHHSPPPSEYHSKLSLASACRPIRYRSANKSLAWPGRKQATATEDFEFHISYL